MLISSPTDYRQASKKKLPKFLFDYIDGGAGTESTLSRNTLDFQSLRLRQRVLSGAKDLQLKAHLLGKEYALPIGLSPVGLTGMYARRGEVQVAKAAQNLNIPMTLSTVSVCPIEEVADKVTQPIWFQLYILKDRGFMKSVLQRALDAGVTTLVFTVDMPLPGPRYRDVHSGMSGRHAPIRRVLQATLNPKWAFNVGLMGRPHDLGNISTYLGKPTKLSDYIGWLGNNFDPNVNWRDLEWIREFWPGNLLIKGILDADDVEDSLSLGADGLIVSNHGGRQLDGAPSTIQALPAIVEKVASRCPVIVDSGIRSGLDVVRALCLGADFTMIGRSYIYALSAGGQSAVENLLGIYESEIKTAMTMMGVKSLEALTPDCLY